MICTKCGTPNDNSSKFCKECGEKVADGSKTTRLSTDEHLKVGEFVYLAYRESEAGHLDNAIAACHGALAINDGNPTTHALLASLYDRKGDLARAIYEYERVVSLNPGSLDDRRKLEQLRAGLLAPVGPSRTARPRSRLADLSWLRNPELRPWLTAVGAFVVIVLIGSLLLRGGSGNGGTSSAAGSREQARATSGPNAGIPGQPVPYGPSAFGPNQPGAGGQPGVQPGVNGPQTDQQDQPEGNATPTEKKPKPGIPAVRVPGTAAATQPPVKPPDASGDAYKPIIVPIIPPPTKPPEVKPVPPPTPTQPAKNAEQRGMELHRMGKYDDAIGAYKEALNQTSDPGGVYRKMALSYQRVGQQDAAIDSYNRGIRAYRDQLASGRDKSEVERNIRACEAGIEVSRNMKQ